MSTTVPHLRVDRLDTLVEHLRTHPDEHDQSSWRAESIDCGTKMCAAGHAIVLFGGDRFRWNTPYAEAHGTRFFAEVYDTERQREVPISIVAAELLGIDWREADYLFSGGPDPDLCSDEELENITDLEYVEMVVNNIKAGAWR